MASIHLRTNQAMTFNPLKYLVTTLLCCSCLLTIQAQSITTKPSEEQAAQYKTTKIDSYKYQYQSFPQFGFDISIPTPLIKNCTRTEGNYHQYCGFLFEEDPLKAESYHVVVMSFPEQMDVSSAESQELLFKALLKPYNAQYGKAVYGESKHEVLIAYIDKDEKGFPSQMGYFFKDNFMICVVVQTHNELQRRFDLVMNSLRFHEDPIPNQESAFDREFNIYTGHKQIAYNIGYPYTYTIDDSVENPFVDVTFTSPTSVSKEQDRYFVAFQQNWESLDALCEHTIGLIQEQQPKTEIIQSGIYSAKAGCFKEYILAYEEQGSKHIVSYYFTQLDKKTYMMVVFFHTESSYQRDKLGIYKVIQSIYVSKEPYIESEHEQCN